MRSRSSGQVLASWVVSALLLAASALACSAGAASAGISGQIAGASVMTSGAAGAAIGGMSAAGMGGAATTGGHAGTTGGVVGGYTTDDTNAGNGGHNGSTTGGTGTAGHAGSNTNEATCQMVKMDYAAELEKQRECKPGAASQCTDRAAAAPGCECRVFIQPSDPFAIEHLSNIGNGWYDADCSMPSCPAKCTSAASGTCQADPKSALGGHCITP